MAFLKAATLKRGPGVGQAHVTVNLEDAISKFGGDITPYIVNIVDLIKSKHVVPGDALSCFKGFFRTGSPTEQYNTLMVLQQVVDMDAQIGHALHNEMCSKRWKERFVQLANTSSNPQVKPAVVRMLERWAEQYRGHEHGMSYTTILREVTGDSDKPLHYGQAWPVAYAPQTTGRPPAPYPPPGPYAGRTGYQPPPPGSPQPYGYPPPPVAYGAPMGGSYGGYGGYGSPPPPPRSPDPPVTLPRQVELASSDVERLKSATSALEAALTDYKADRINFAALQSAMTAGSSAADKCKSSQAHLEAAMGGSEMGDEALLARVLATADALSSALDKWNSVSNQDLAAPGAGCVEDPSSKGASQPSGSKPPPPKQPAPMADLISIDDDTPSPSYPASGQAAASHNQFSGAAASPLDVMAGLTLTPPPPAAISPAPVGGLAHVGSPGYSAASGSSSNGVFASAPLDRSAPLDAQVAALQAELTRLTQLHHSTLEASHAAHTAELQQVKAQALQRVQALMDHNQALAQRNAELEASLASLQVELSQARGGASSRSYSPAAAYSTAAATFSTSHSLTATSSGPAAGPTGYQAYPSPAAPYAGPTGSPYAGPTGSPYAGLTGSSAYPAIQVSANNPFASALAAPAMPPASTFSTASALTGAASLQQSLTAAPADLFTSNGPTPAPAAPAAATPLTSSQADPFAELANASKPAVATVFAASVVPPAVHAVPVAANGAGQPEGKSWVGF